MSRQCPRAGWAVGQLGRKRLVIWDSSFSTMPMCCCLSALLTMDLHLSLHLELPARGREMPRLHCLHVTRPSNNAFAGRCYDRQCSGAGRLYIAGPAPATHAGMQAHLHCSQTACRACCPMSPPNLPAALASMGKKDRDAASLTAFSSDIDAARDHLRRNLTAKAWTHSGPCNPPTYACRGLSTVRKVSDTSMPSIATWAAFKMQLVRAVLTCTSTPYSGQLHTTSAISGFQQC